VTTAVDIAVERPGRVRAWLTAHARPVTGALAFRFACYAVMTALALWNEYRPAPTLPDLLVQHVPYLPWVDRLNYVAWLLLYVPMSWALVAADTGRWCRYMVTGGLVSLARGVTISLTGLGPPDPAHAGSGLAGRAYGEALVDLLSPIDVFAHGSARTYLTQDMFFSGHTASTVLLLFYVWRFPRLRWPMLAAHLLIVASVFFSHLHYAIDVVGAYAVTFSLYALREWRPRLRRAA
jgi:hypothetical protein